MKKATEGGIMAAQEQAIRTRSIGRCIDKKNIPPLCRLCGERGETVAHCLNARSFVKHSTRNGVMTELPRLFIGSFAKLMTWNTWKSGMIMIQRRQQKKENIKILWDMKIQTDKILEHSRRGRKWTSTRN